MGDIIVAIIFIILKNTSIADFNRPFTEEDK